MKQQITLLQAADTLPEPFVNEECGDTMWDAVLLQAEERIQQPAVFAPCKKVEKQPAARLM